ncbi:MAG: hypothetical protein Q4D81_14350 [Eubacteriales bacterium]|nr:hypothetical protein [Eubacteriales bacterium]
MNCDKPAENHPEKKARQEKPWIFPVVLLFCVLFCLTGAAYLYYLYTPSSFRKEEVYAYVRGFYGEGWTLCGQKDVGSAEGTKTEVYTYEDGNGNRFRVFSTSVPDMKNGLPTGRYQKALYDDYFSSVIGSRMEALETISQKIKKESGPELEIEKLTESSDVDGARYAFRLYLENSSQLEAAAQCLEEIDSCLSFSCRAGEPPYNRMQPQLPCIRIYLYPGFRVEIPDAVSGAAEEGEVRSFPSLASAAGDWKSAQRRESYRISEIPFSDGTSSGRYKKEQLLTRLENDYVDAAKTFGRDYYTISGELWDRYPAPVLTLVNVGGYDLTALPEENSGTYRLYYHRGTRTYWMTGLDPFEDYDGNPFGDYPGRGAFAGLVGYLGGSFTARGRESTWRIGTTSWKASLETARTADSLYTYKSVHLLRNGNHQALDEVPALFAGTGVLPSGRPYSIRDLIRMLNVRITVNQKEMTAVMFRDYGD